MPIRKQEVQPGTMFVHGERSKEVTEKLGEPIGQFGELWDMR